MRLRLPFALLVPPLSAALPVLCLSLAAAPAAHAQFAVYGMGSGGILGATPTIPGKNQQGNAGFAAGGFTFGAYDEFVKAGPLHFGLDGRYFSQSSASSNNYGNKIHGGLVGARLALKFPILPLKAYVQAEVGGVGTNYGINAETTSSSAWQINGGVDLTVLPHLDLRAEYGGGLINAYQGGNQTLQEVGGGAVLRF